MESSSSLLIFRTALLSLLSQGAEHCSLDTRSTSGCDPCLRNPSSHNRPFPKHTTQRRIHTHWRLRLNSFCWGGSGRPWGNKGVKAHSHIFKIFCVSVWKTGNTSSSKWENYTILCSTVAGGGRGGGGERFRSTRRSHFPDCAYSGCSCWEDSNSLDKHSLWHLGCLPRMHQLMRTRKK